MEMAAEKNVLVAMGEADKYREYRKGNWTLNETMILIQAKKMDYERRRMKEGDVGSSRPQEMRWKWVEDFCWRHGCYRSQNQCNDRWDNLMRDYKKVRAYEMSLTNSSAQGGSYPALSYWKLERIDRKERNLPSNLLPEIYEALTEVVQMRDKLGATATAAPARAVEEEKQQVADPEPVPLIASQLMTSIDSEDSQHSISPERKRKRGGGEGSSSRSNTTMELTSAISKCASIVAEALQTGEQKEELRHKDRISLEERKAKLEESKSQISIQSMDGLATAINKLASSILGLVTDRVQSLQK
ncbi:hypothetical protein Cni_G08269 [Canna indica]|uniref:Myb-like domain-containing protein n=1 Tax=Canna indica TaxID=4628 RepID=A0AAQ3K2J9_9LILI|nr:hypothetical protein Cni_G08269 [Canna indica]